jgi:hypothetical protein
MLQHNAEHHKSMNEQQAVLGQQHFWQSQKYLVNFS